ncbi:MAG: DUF2666 family protein [Candidatus Marsarchaeota archaeon]|nr:DUF2666 family protein [Candidatus Marsarchaeota archaeon]
MDEPEEYVDFLVKYKDWIAIKRMGIRSNTKPEEIVFQLAGIRNAIDNRAFGILGIKTNVLDSYAGEATKGMRKSPDSLAEAAKRFGASEAKSAIEQACDNKDVKPLAEIYLLGKIISNLGYDTSINQVAMSKIWKNLKVPKPRGRVAGAKKKEQQQAPE